jgi:hypothetical protein
VIPTSRANAEDGVLWEDRHLSWARAVGRRDLKDEEALTRFVVYRLRKSGVTHIAGTAIHDPWAPLWLHALWDVMTEEEWTGSKKRPVTPKRLDSWAVRKAAEDEPFRRAIEVVYQEASIPGLADFLVQLFVGR